MLETDEVDDDYFTPVGNTTLQNIFGTSSVPKETLKNETLKYSPPKLETVIQKPEEPKTSCVFASVLTGYEWCNNVYTSKGKMGFAVIKAIQSSSHSIILYDSKKTTMSSATISPLFQVTVKGSTYISYYDNNKKYWSLYGTEKEIENVINFLKTINVSIKVLTGSDTGTVPEPNKDENNSIIKDIEKQPRERDNKHKNNDIQPESDTDSSINNKNKAAILNRMATMGHSVLPPNTASNEKSSDSDTTDSNSHAKIVKHKTVKNLKKVILDKTLDRKNMDMAHKNTDSTIHSTEIQNVKTYYNDFNHQLIPLPSTSVITSPVGNEMNLFMAEQRISNSELRINMSRVSDKVDQALTKLNDIQSNDSKTNNDFNMEVLQKLLREYENKIKNYEEIIKNRKRNSGNQETLFNYETGELKILEDRVLDLEKIIKDKNDYVLLLKNEIQATKESKTSNDILQSKISELEQELLSKNEEISKLKDNMHYNKKLNTDLDGKVKSIMNEAFQVIVNQLDDDESYSGETVKNTIAKVIRTVTKKSLNDL